MSLFGTLSLPCEDTARRWLSIGLAKKFEFFPYDGSGSAQLSLTPFETVLLGCIVIAIITVCILKKPIKIGEFLCSHFNAGDGRKYTTFSAYYALLFQER